MHAPNRRTAVLLLGPTGAGKTPLGDLIEQRGWGGLRCGHFDFGARLRMVAAPDARWCAGLSPDELGVVRDCLEHGALLENETFGIAAKILDRFVTETLPGADDLLVMNGLPRHVDQARMLEGQVDIEKVVVLDCDAPTVLERIRLDTGGDRGQRADDAVEAVRRRLQTFERRTVPLVEHYRNLGADVIRLPVGTFTSPGRLYDDLVSNAGQLTA